ncbi:PLP-dependent aminotransferase family protein [Alicyclobacillus fodiniaquatilis]|uniref:PLP-dependent aminotransferase family protein n=1 Tax=Alicyclobacillus fodiniaquatilis TaxID=1661150 RepID=A0ABW4JFU7_9BACL
MQLKLAKTASEIKASAVREILKLTQHDDVISFAGGLPAEEFFPAGDLQKAFERVFQQGNKVLQYGLTEGHPPLRDDIRQRLIKKDINVNVEDVLLTTGSQQAIDLLAKVYLEPGDVVLTENPTYLAALQAFKYYSVNIVAVESDSQGMIPEDLLAKIKQYQPKLAYVTPTFANPTGIVWSEERRLALLDACAHHDVLILEDDPYGDIKFHQDETYPSLFTLGKQAGFHGVIYTSTFSKTVVPALRIGWVCGHRQIVQAMTRAKQATDLHSSSIDQQALHSLINHFDLDGHIQNIAAEYRRRMQHMMRLLAALPSHQVHFVEPKGGMFLWLELPAEIDADVLLQSAVKAGVAFVPGTEFYAGNPRRNTLRLNFSHTNAQRMTVGMNRLNDAITSFLKSDAVI